ncbi:hypothetical protein NQ317_005172 [Molorchus minor]|uniref:Uncharacterized protein n=1 Tax=Molorchus minor TaxID=1323400 RepID=A0ABQ9JC78_9CUCU|nr:hypothetical protein NQ317_005172 [Molorchus minor]
MQVTQRFLQCRGVDGPDDYPTTKLPDSCCINGQCSTFEHRYHKDGCALKVYEFLRKSTNIVGGVAIGIAAVEVSFICTIKNAVTAICGVID